MAENKEIEEIATTGDDEFFKRLRDMEKRIIAEIEAELAQEAEAKSEQDDENNI